MRYVGMSIILDSFIVFCSSSSSVGSPPTFPPAVMLRVIPSTVVVRIFANFITCQLAAIQACVYCLPSAGYQSGSARVRRP